MTDLHTYTRRVALVRMLEDEGDEIPESSIDRIRDLALEAMGDADPVRRWEYRDDGAGTVEMPDSTLAEAIESSDEANRDGTYWSSSTQYWPYTLYCPDTGEEHGQHTTVEPPEPECAGGHTHDWQSPHEVVGGLTGNPGVYGHGGGVIITEVCPHCGTYRVTDTWAEGPYPGQQGWESTSYREADERSREWVNARASETITDALDEDDRCTEYEIDEDGDIVATCVDEAAAEALRQNYYYHRNLPIRYIDAEAASVSITPLTI